MKLLLDTHVRFWSLTEDAKLPARIRKCMLEEAETSFVSAVTGWEIAIKVKLGKWPEAAILLPDISTKILAAGFELLPLRWFRPNAQARSISPIAIRSTACWRRKRWNSISW